MTDNPITRLFRWWNQAYADHAFTPEGFAEHFTADAPFIVDGGVRGVGPVEIDAHFQRIRAMSNEAELSVPPKAMLADDALGFVRYETKVRVGDQRGVEQCVALARFEGDKIASIEVFQQALV